MNEYERWSLLNRLMEERHEAMMEHLKQMMDSLKEQESRFEWPRFDPMDGSPRENIHLEFEGPRKDGSPRKTWDFTKKPGNPADLRVDYAKSKWPYRGKVGLLKNPGEAFHRHSLTVIRTEYRTNNRRFHYRGHIEPIPDDVAERYSYYGPKSAATMLLIDCIVQSEYVPFEFIPNENPDRP